jgi:hypothetical protein
MFWKLVRFSSGLFFAVTCFIGFIALMILNLYVLESLFPGIVNAVDHLSGGKGQNLLRLIISCPIPVTVCFGWYKFFKWVDKKLEKAALGNSGEIIDGKETALDPNKENKLHGYLAACAGISGFTLILGLCLGINIFNYFEKADKPRSMQEFISFLAGFPIVTAIGYAIARSIVIKKVSNEVARPDR